MLSLRYLRCWYDGTFGIFAKGRFGVSGINEYLEPVLCVSIEYFALLEREYTFLGEIEEECEYEYLLSDVCRGCVSGDGVMGREGGAALKSEK